MRFSSLTAGYDHRYIGLSPPVREGEGRALGNAAINPAARAPSLAHIYRTLLNILRQSYGYLTIMPKLRATYDERVIYKTSYEERKDFLRYDSLAKS